jgi:hypothetical protein
MYRMALREFDGEKIMNMRWEALKAGFVAQEPVYKHQE